MNRLISLWPRLLKLLLRPRSLSWSYWGWARQRGWMSSQIAASYHFLLCSCHSDLRCICRRSSWWGREQFRRRLPWRWLPRWWKLPATGSSGGSGRGTLWSAPRSSGWCSPSESWSRGRACPAWWQLKWHGLYRRNSQRAAHKQRTLRSTSIQSDPNERPTVFFSWSLPRPY